MPLGIIMFKKYNVTIKPKNHFYFDFSILDGKTYKVFARSPQKAVSLIRFYIDVFIHISPDRFNYTISEIKKRKG